MQAPLSRPQTPRIFDVLWPSHMSLVSHILLHEILQTMASASHANLETFANLLNDILENPSQNDWRAKWQRASECLWVALGDGEQAKDNQFETYLELLQNSERFGIASMVIPELREPSLTEAEPESGQRQRILQICRDQIQQAGRMKTMKQADFDTEEYREEKRILRSAEMHRARILLHDSGTFDSESKTAIEEWLKKAPDVL